MKPTSTNDRRCRDSMVVGFTTTYGIRLSASHGQTSSHNVDSSTPHNERYLNS